MYPCTKQPSGWCGSDTQQNCTSALFSCLGSCSFCCASSGCLEQPPAGKLAQFPWRVTFLAACPCSSSCLTEKCASSNPCQMWSSLLTYCCSCASKPRFKVQIWTCFSCLLMREGPRHNLVGSLAKTECWNIYRIKGVFLGNRGFTFVVGSSSVSKHLSAFAR